MYYAAAHEVKRYIKSDFATVSQFGVHLNTSPEMSSCLTLLLRAPVDRTHTIRRIPRFRRVISSQKLYTSVW